MLNAKRFYLKTRPKPLQRRNLIKFSTDPETIQEHPDHPSGPTISTFDVPWHNNCVPDGDVPGTSTLALDHEWRVREVAGLDWPGSVGRRRLSRIRRGACYRGGRATARPARALQPAATWFRGEAADLPGWSGIGCAAATSQSSLSPRHTPRESPPSSSSRSSQPARGRRGRHGCYRDRHRAPLATPPGSRDGGATTGLLSPT